MTTSRVNQVAIGIMFDKAEDGHLVGVEGEGGGGVGRAGARTGGEGEQQWRGEGLGVWCVRRGLP